MIENMPEVARIRISLEDAGLILERETSQAAAEAVFNELLPVRFRAINRSLNERNIAYAIKNSDLELVKEVGTVAAAIAAGVPNAASIIVGLLVFLVRYRKKRIRLTGEQVLVLKNLSDAKDKGRSSAELTDLMRKSKKMSVHEIESILTSLVKAVQSNGVQTALVEERNGRWYAIDI